MHNSRATGKGELGGLLLPLLVAVVLIPALNVGCKEDDQRGEPPNEGGLPEHCEGVGTIEVTLEVDMSESISALDHWLDINYGGELRKAFRNCCTVFDEIRATYDSGVVDYPDDYTDCEDMGRDSWDVWYGAGMHLILAMKIENADVLGYTFQYGPASNGSSSWVFVQRIDERIEAADSHASRKAFGTREATHELGHHRAELTEACYELNGEYYVNSDHHYSYDECIREPDGDCVMASPYVVQDGMDVRSVCGSGKSQLYDIYFCFCCREVIKTRTW